MPDPRRWTPGGVGLREKLRTIGAAVAAVAFFLLLYGALHYSAVVSAVLAVAIYFGAYFLLKPTDKIGRTEVDSIRDGESSLKLMKEAEKDILSLEKYRPQIQDEKTGGYVEGLAKTGRRIITYLAEHPEKIPDAHRFADYYLDMAEKLVSRYLEMQKVAPGAQKQEEAYQEFERARKQAEAAFANVAGGTSAAAQSAQSGSFETAFQETQQDSSVGSVMVQTSEALKTLNVAFDRQLAKLMRGDLMDVEMDIKVLKDMMHMEGDS